MPSYIDQIGNAIHLEKVDSILSLVPSQTELLYYLGLEEKVIGITKFCIKPDKWFRSKTRIGGTKSLNLDLIRSLQPDLIIGNKEENNQGEIEQLISEGFNVWMSDIFNDEENLSMIRSIGEICNVQQQADRIISEFNSKSLSLNTTNIKVCYFIWKDPYFIVGDNCYINYNLNKIGLSNAASKFNRYKEAIPDDILKLKSDYYLFSSEPYPFSEKHITELESIFGKDKCLLVDGEMFSWTGYRPILALDYFSKFLEELDLKI